MAFPFSTFIFISLSYFLPVLVAFLCPYVFWFLYKKNNNILNKRVSLNSTPTSLFTVQVTV